MQYSGSPSKHILKIYEYSRKWESWKKIYLKNTVLDSQNIWQWVSLKNIFQKSTTVKKMFQNSLKIYISKFYYSSLWKNDFKNPWQYKSYENYIKKYTALGVLKKLSFKNPCQWKSWKKYIKKITTMRVLEKYIRKNQCLWPIVVCKKLFF